MWKYLVEKVKDLLVKLVLVFCRKDCMILMKNDFEDEIKKRVNEQVLKQWFENIEKLENFTETSPIRLKMLHYVSAESISEYLRCLGLNVYSAVDVDRWLRTTMRNVPREDIYFFLQDTIASYTFIRNYVFPDAYLIQLGIRQPPNPRQAG
ncbi:hypothetical protein DMENIID0001_152770 [Sergentomyia squamirostris]